MKRRPFTFKEKPRPTLEIIGNPRYGLTTPDRPELVLPDHAVDLTCPCPRCAKERDRLRTAMEQRREQLLAKLDEANAKDAGLHSAWPWTEAPE